MLSAVESFGPVSGPSAAHLYAHHHHPHHNPYAIAAAAAAAGSAAAAAAAAVIPPPPLPQTPLTPTTPTHSTQHQIFQSHQQHLLTSHQQQQQQQQQQLHQHHLGYFLPPPPSVNLSLLSPPPTSPSSCSTPGNSNSSHSNNIILPTNALVLTSKCSPLQLADYQHQHQQQQPQQQQQLSIQHPQPSPSHSPVERSPRRCSFKALNSHRDDSEVMSSAEFARPHPKQPRNNNGASQINNGHSIPMNQRSPSNNPKSLSTANAAKGCSNNQEKHLNINNNGMLRTGHASRTPPSKYSTSDQSAPVNLVTSHHNSHNNHSGNHMISSIRTRLSTTPPDNSCSSSSGSSVDVENDGSMSPLGSSLPLRKGHAESNVASTLFGGGGVGPVPKITYDTTAAAAAVAAAAYQFNFPHLYASRAALYGTSALFTGHHTPLPPPPGALRPHPSYLTGTVAGSSVSPHDNSPASLSAAYMQAVQSIYHHPSMQVSQPSSPASQAITLQHQKNALCTPTSSVLPNKPAGFASGVGPVSAIMSTAPISAPALSNGHVTLSLATPNDLRQKNSTALPSAPVIANGGTYLNKKVNNTAADGETFKVPSGKEGSLKHRILTRPSQQLIQQQQQQQPEKAEVRPASMTVAVVRANNATTNFTKGAYIELANGVLRRVEDMRTEDFIQCAERSPHHQLAESTVVKITTTPNNNVVITFSYDKNRSKADVEVAPEHPFFVYGQGWASYQPELSHKLFALKCQRLQVGDICISLTTREPPPAIASQSRQMHNYKFPQTVFQSSPPSSHSSPSESLRIAADTLSIQPQNLSRKLHPASQDDGMNTSAVGTTLGTLGTNRLGGARTSGYTPLHGMPPLHLMPPHLQTHQGYSDMADLAAAAYVNNTQILRSGAPTQSHLSPGSSAIDNIYQAHHQHLQQQQQHHQHQDVIFHGTSSARLLPGQTLVANTPMQLTRPPSNHNPQSYYESPPSSTDGDHHLSLSGNGSGINDGACGDEQDQPVDASLSRKRRWSAPETIYDDGSGDDDVSRPAKIVSYANSHQAQATNRSGNTLSNCR